MLDASAYFDDDIFVVPLGCLKDWKTASISIS